MTENHRFKHILGKRWNAAMSLLTRLRARIGWSLVALLVLGLLAWRARKWLHVLEEMPPRDSVALEVQIVGGLFLLAGLYFAWRRILAADKTAAAALRTAEATHEGQITERFTRAIDQLGSDKLEVRLGGIYALERIARDSPKDHWQVMEVLTAFVRENAPYPAEETAETDTPPRPRTDIQAILNVLGRRERSYEKEGQVLELAECDLRGANLVEAHLEKAVLVGAHLESAFLADAHLEGTVLMAAHLESAKLLGADLKNAYLNGAFLEKANLGRANLEKAFLGGANLQEANIGEANLRNARLANANLQGALLYGTDLTGAEGLTPAQINQAITAENTKLPPGLDLT